MVGEEFLQHFIRLGHLGPDDRVLDVSSGVGRMAIPLSHFLSPQATYDGFDVWADGVDWCRRVLTSSAPRFTFSHADLYNAQFNPQGHAEVAGYRLPYEDAHFDFALLCAINHLTQADQLHYIVEIGRLLRPGGTYFGTWFLTTAGNSSALPSWARQVACPEDVALSVLDAAHIDVSDVHPGLWTGGSSRLTFQDVVIGRSRDVRVV